MAEDLEGMAIPKAPRRFKGVRNLKGEEAKLIGDEMAAMAYVAMELGSYVYPKGMNRPTEGRTVNTRELMRVAGYSYGTWDDFDKLLGSRRNFWQLVELYRLRRTDPMFRTEQRNRIIGDIFNKLTDHFYERVTYYGHTLSTRDILQGMKTIVDVGYRVSEVSAEKESRSNKLLEKMSAEQRAAAISGLKARAVSEIEALESLEKAHAGADDGH